MAKFNKKDKGESGPSHQSLRKALGHHVNKGHLTMTNDPAGDDIFEDFDQEKRSTGRGKVTIGAGKKGIADRPGTGKAKRTFPKGKVALD